MEPIFITRPYAPRVQICLSDTSQAPKHLPAPSLPIDAPDLVRRFCVYGIAICSKKGRHDLMKTHG